MKAGKRTFEELVGRYSPDVQSLALVARAFIRRLLPKVDETVDSSGPYVGYGYGSGYKGMVCSLILSKTGVKLGIVGGAEFPDPHGLLEGSGKVHRHIVLKAPKDLEQRGVRELVRAANRASQERIKGKS